jgi:hypothetical protein
MYPMPPSHATTHACEAAALFILGLSVWCLFFRVQGLGLLNSHVSLPNHQTAAPVLTLKSSLSSSSSLPTQRPPPYTPSARSTNSSCTESRGEEGKKRFCAKQLLTNRAPMYVPLSRAPTLPSCSPLSRTFAPPCLPSSSRASERLARACSCRV